MKQIKSKLLIALSAIFFLTACTSQIDSEQAAKFRVEGDIAHMVGVIDRDTPELVETMIADNPEVRTIFLDFVPGSMDDEANLEASRMIRAANLSTHVPAKGEIASGGVDFFLAGSTRSIEENAQIGVHSWADNSNTVPKDLPRDHIYHQLYLDYYQEMGIDEAFYWFTLEAAPADSIHWMTRTEIEYYGMISK
jgi:hypothetical protein